MKNDAPDFSSKLSSDTAQEISAKISQLRQNFEEIRLRLLAERKSGKPNQSQLEADIATKQSEIEKVQNKINKAKAQAKKRKREIDDWKQWFHTLPGTDRAEDQAKLTLEINWRGAEINTRQNEIGILESQKWKLKGDFETLRQQLFALKEGCYDLPIEEDPRLVHAEKTLQREVAALEATQAALK